MAAPDSLLKLLVSSFMTDVASWLLHTPVRAAHPVNVVLPTPTLTVDQVLHVTLATGHEGLLHLADFPHYPEALWVIMVGG